MQKDDLVFIGHMLDTARKALVLVRGKSREDFDRDEVLDLALTHLLQVIGEAARRVSTGFIEQHPEIPWITHCAPERTPSAPTEEVRCAWIRSAIHLGSSSRSSSIERSTFPI
jgi:Protein of unknown function DUF86